MEPVRNEPRIRAASGAADTRPDPKARQSASQNGPTRPATQPRMQAVQGSAPAPSSDGPTRGPMGPIGPAREASESTRDPAARQRRSRLRPKTIAGKRLTRAEIQEGISLIDEMWYERPKTRADCAEGIRPCPFVSCKYHLYLDVKDETQSIKLNFPHLEVWEMEHSCALDVSEQGGLTLEEVGHILNLTRERVRQVEVGGLDRLKHAGVVEDIERVFGNATKFEDP